MRIIFAVLPQTLNFVDFTTAHVASPSFCMKLQLKLFFNQEGFFIK